MPRKFYPPEFKAQVTKEAIETNNTALVAAKHGLSQRTVYNWFSKEINKDSIAKKKSQKSLEKKNQELELEFIPPGACNKNAHVESFNSIIESDFLQVRYFRDFEDVYRQMMEWMSFYNEKRIHGSLKMMSPNDFTKMFYKNEITIENVVA